MTTKNKYNNKQYYRKVFLYDLMFIVALIEVGYSLALKLWHFLFIFTILSAYIHIRLVRAYREKYKLDITDPEAFNKP